MRIVDYLCAKYRTTKPTTMLLTEARAFGIPYPLPNGWLKTYGQIEITSDNAKWLEEALNKSTKDTAPNGLQVLKDAHIELKSIPDATSKEFLSSKAWLRARYTALKRCGMRCQACGNGPHNGSVLNVDHIKPRRLFPQHALDQTNLQVLCAECNEGKGNWDMTNAAECGGEPSG